MAPISMENPTWGGTIEARMAPISMEKQTTGGTITERDDSDPHPKTNYGRHDRGQW